jgi:hypothetical protein
MRTKNRSGSAVFVCALGAALGGFGVCYGDDPWQELGGGASATVHALVAHGDDLYVGGAFNSVGGNSSLKKIARWHGTENAWHSIDGGMNNTVRGLAMSAECGLAAGGMFNKAGSASAKRIATCDGGYGPWTALSNGAQGNVLAVAIYNEEIIIGGDFSSPAENIARWDAALGIWRAIEDGLDHKVMCLREHADHLIVGGKFGWAGDVQVRRIACWDGEGQWQPFAPLVEEGVPHPSVRAIEIWQGDIVIGGDWILSHPVGPQEEAQWYVARWSGEEWLAVGGAFNGRIRALADFNGDLFAGGEFTTNADCDAPANHIARFDGRHWHPVDGGVNSTVWALAAYNGQLIVGGDFTNAGGAPASRLARWTPSGGTPGNPPGDLTGNGSVGVPDLLILLGCWGPVVTGCEYADLTGSGAVGVADLLILLANWGP